MSDSTAGDHTREAFFFGDEGRKKYAMAHVPVAGNGKAVVFCNPFADDVQRSYRALYNFAELLAEAGYLVLRFEYRGCGDSQGVHADTDVTTRLEDISEAVSYVREKYLPDRIALLGLRLGSSLAAMSAAGEESVSALVMWEPVIDGRQYIYDSLKTNITTQAAVYRKVQYSRDQLIENMRKGEELCIDGYEIGERLFDQASAIDLTASDNPFTGPTMWTTIWPKGRPVKEDAVASIRQVVDIFPNASHAIVHDIHFWTNKRVYVPSSPELFDQTLNWLRGNL